MDTHTHIHVYICTHTHIHKLAEEFQDFINYEEKIKGHQGKEDIFIESLIFN